MDAVQINIPSTFKSPLSEKEEEAAFAANVWRALDEIGIDQFTILCPMFFDLSREFKQGRFTKGEFQNAVNNLAILRGLKK